jgi:hypothetical protein
LEVILVGGDGVGGRSFLYRKEVEEVADLFFHSQSPLVG